MYGDAVPPPPPPPPKKKKESKIKWQLDCVPAKTKSRALIHLWSCFVFAQETPYLPIFWSWTRASKKTQPMFHKNWSNNNCCETSWHHPSNPFRKSLFRPKKSGNFPCHHGWENPKETPSLPGLLLQVLGLFLSRGNGTPQSFKRRNWQVPGRSDAVCTSW